MFGWLRRPKPPLIDPNTRAFDPSQDLDVESVLFGRASPSPAPTPTMTAAPNVFQEVEELDPEEKDIIMQAARQAQQEIRAVMQETGVTWTEKEQHDKMFARAVEIRAQLKMFQEMVIDVREEHERSREQFADMQDKVVSMRQRTSLDQIGDFWREHPFLVGFFGADIVHKLKKQLGQR